MTITFSRFNDGDMRPDAESRMDIGIKHNKHGYLHGLYLYIPSLDIFSNSYDRMSEFQEFLTNEELGDIFYFVLNSSLSLSEYIRTKDNVRRAKENLLVMKNSKLKYIAFVLDVLKSLDFTGDVAKNVLSKYL